MATVSDTTSRPLFRRHARRPRLTRLLDESVAQTILITAPAGYGKTTLAAEWVHGRDDVVWYRATAASADLAAFSAGIAEVIAPLVPGAGERLRQRLRVADTPERAARPLAELLAEDLAEWPTGAWLVVDDYHLVTDSEPVETFVDWLLTLAPIRLLVTTRRRPRWASARRILYGEVTEVGRDQLAMTREEARRVLGGDRSDEAVRALVSQAKGWSALIGLAALSASHEIPEERVSDALFRYFAEEVVRQEPPEVQRFMLLASVPASVSPHVAREVLEASEPEEILERLREEGLLHQNGAGQLRFHPLLRDFLRRKLEAEDPDLLQRLSTSAIADARGGGNWEDAFDLAAESAQLELAAEILGEAAPELLAAGRVETIERWLAACAAAALDQPAAVLARAEVLTRQGRLSEASVIARDLAERLTAADPSASRAWYLAGQAFYLGSQSQLAVRCHRRARELAERPDDLKNSLKGLFLAEAELELESAEGFLAEFEALAGGGLDAQLYVLACRQVIASHRASFAGIWNDMAPLVPLAEYASDLLAKSNFLAQAACVAIARANYAVALALAEQALHVSSELRHDFAMGSCLAYKAGAAIGLRHFKLAGQTLNELSTLRVRKEDPYLHATYLINRMKLALCEGDPVRAIQYLTPSIELEPPKLTQGELLGFLSIALAAAGRGEKARACAREARQTTTGVEPLFCSRCGELIADLICKGPSRSLTARGTALVRDAVAAEFVDSLVISYRAWPPLLRVIAQDETTINQLRPVLREANDQKLAREAKIELGESDLTPKLDSLLTPRETEVLRLMTEGLSNSDIAKRLFITESTAKVHVHRILSKLGAKSRLHAVVLARRYE